MKKKREEGARDVDECKSKVNEILAEYNCAIYVDPDLQRICYEDKDNNQIAAVHGDLSD